MFSSKVIYEEHTNLRKLLKNNVETNIYILIVSFWSITKKSHNTLTDMCINKMLTITGRITAHK